MGGYRLAGLAPASGAVAVTPNDGTSIPATRGLWVGGAGNIQVIMEDGSQVTYTGVPAGTLLHISVTRVFATSTTATSMLALY